MYDNVRVDISNNTPDRFVGTMAHAKGHRVLPVSQLQKSAVVASAQSFGQPYLSAFDEKQADASAAMSKAQSQATGLFGQARGPKRCSRTRYTI